MMDWWDLGEWTGRPGHVLAMHEIPCAFCSSVGNFGVVNHLERAKANDARKVLNYDTLQCGNCELHVCLLVGGEAQPRVWCVPRLQGTALAAEHDNLPKALAARCRQLLGGSPEEH